MGSPRLGKDKCEANNDYIKRYRNKTLKNTNKKIESGRGLTKMSYLLTVVSRDLFEPVRPDFKNQKLLQTEHQINLET